MPRSKTRKPRKAANTAMTDTLRRQPRRNPFRDAGNPHQGMARRKRPDMRPPKFPGRLGGR